MAKLLDWCGCRRPRVAYYLSLAYALILILSMVGGGAAIGSLYAWSRADSIIAQQRADYKQSLSMISGQLKSAADINEKTAGAIEQTAGAVELVVETARGAAQTADGAAATARGAATTAKAAASTARDAASDLSQALTTNSSDTTGAPDWLGGP